MQLLKKLYHIYSPSSEEGVMSKFIQRELKGSGIQDFQVLGNQIYRIIKDTPLLVAHMDHVTFKPITKLVYDIEKKTMSGDGNIGADDKNGIWILLNLLKSFKDISFIFSDMEEHGGNIDAVFDKIQLEDKEILNTIKYCLVFDRRNGSDVVGVSNNYCNKDLEDDIVHIGTKYEYTSSGGIWSDCNTIRKHVPCVNLSCGYYSAHTVDEYTVIPELFNALAFGEAILKSLTQTYSRTIISYKQSWVKTYYNKSKSYFKDTHISYQYNDRWYDDEKYQDEGDMYYCTYCGEHFSEEEVIIIGECPWCAMHTLEVVGYHAPSYISNNGNLKEYYYCAHCDTYTDINDRIIGLEDSPGICRHCGNVQYRFREFEEDNDIESCKSCDNYESKVCDDSKCLSCPFLKNENIAF